MLGRVAFWAALIAVPLGLVSDGLYVAAAGFRVDLAGFTRFDVLAAEPTLLRWAAFTDLGAFYLPLAPIALALRQRFAGQDALLDLYTAGALAFAAIGGAAAAVLGIVGPALATGNAAAAADARAAYAVAAQVLADVVFVAIWQTFGALALGTFLVGIGRRLRVAHRNLGSFTIGTGVVAFTAGLARIAGLEPVAIAAIVLWLPLLTVWSGWLALAVLRVDATP